MWLIPASCQRCVGQSRPAHETRQIAVAPRPENNTDIPNPMATLGKECTTLIFFSYYLVERGLITVNHVVEALDRQRKQLPLTGKSHFS